MANKTLIVSLLLFPLLTYGQDLKSHKQFLWKMTTLNQSLPREIWDDIKICLPLIEYYSKNSTGKDYRTITIDSETVRIDIPKTVNLPLVELSDSQVINEITLINRCNFLSHYSKQTEITVFNNGHVNETNRSYICDGCHPLVRASFKGHVIQQMDNGIIAVNIERKHISMTRVTKHLPDDEVLLFVKGAEAKTSGPTVIMGVLDDTKRMISRDGFKKNYRVVHFQNSYKIGAYFKRFTELSKLMRKKHKDAVCAINNNKNKERYFKLGCFKKIGNNAQRWPASL